MPHDGQYTICPSDDQERLICQRLQPTLILFADSALHLHYAEEDANVTQDSAPGVLHTFTLSTSNS